LRDDGEHSSLSSLKELEDSLNGKESVRILLLSESLEEDRKVGMVVQLLKIDVI
jgi:hypothetical protein